MRKFLTLLLLLSFILLGASCVEEEVPKINEPEEPVIHEESVFSNSTFEVHFIDVGQADSALVLCDGKSMLIDGGNVADSDLLYSYLKKEGVEHLDYVIGTHAHEDHIGGLSGALNFATVSRVFCSTDTYDSTAFDNFKKYVQKRGAEIEISKTGDSFKLGSADVLVIASNADDSDENNKSIVLKITYGKTSFLFTGDAEREAEEIILESGFDLKSTVLKVGHHGSEYSTTYPFLREIMPEFAVISVGNNNTYGHPTDEALSRLRDAYVKVYRTDMQGTIICTSDGEKVSFQAERNKDADTLSSVRKEEVKEESTTVDNNSFNYVLNSNSSSMKFHYPDCSSAKKMKEENKIYFTGTREEVIKKGYSPCGNCKP